jgi:hypothetical protein
MGGLSGAIPPGSNITGPLQIVVAKGMLGVGQGAAPPELPTVTAASPGAGVWGYVGLLGEMPEQTNSPPYSCGVYGQGGVVGVNGYQGTIQSNADVAGSGVVGYGNLHGVYGFGGTDAGVVGEATSGPGVRGISTGNAGVSGTTSTGYGVYGQSTGSGGVAGRFDGAVDVNGNATFSGNITIDGNITSVNTIAVQNDVTLAGADCAEQFDVTDGVSADPGTLVVIDSGGKLRPSSEEYDKRVAGVVSGAGEYRPALVLDRRESATERISVALVGKVYCKVDADYGPIEVGDLLTTSKRPGFAMRAGDRVRAFGAVIGKALAPLQNGQGSIPILVALQ